MGEMKCPLCGGRMLRGQNAAGALKRRRLQPDHLDKK